MPVVRPTIEEMQKHYPSSSELHRDVLFKSIGWDREIDNPAFLDTCAIRGSIGLLGCNVPVRGRMQILKGPLKGRSIEPGQQKLSVFLREYWGPPEKFKTNELFRLSGRCGVISHFNINPESPIAQGHFDILDPTPQDLFKCASKCHWGAGETWFWPLPRGSRTSAKSLR